MKPVIFDDELRAKLGDLKEHVQLRTTEGETVARVVPEVAYKFLFDLVVLGPHSERRTPTREEALAEIRAGGGYTTEQVMEHARMIAGAVQ